MGEAAIFVYKVIKDVLIAVQTIYVRLATVYLMLYLLFLNKKLVNPVTLITVHYVIKEKNAPVVSKSIVSLQKLTLI